MGRIVIALFLNGDPELYSTIVCESWTGASRRNLIRSKAARGGVIPQSYFPHENVYMAISSGCLDLPTHPFFSSYMMENYKNFWKTLEVNTGAVEQLQLY